MLNLSDAQTTLLLTFRHLNDDASSPLKGAARASALRGLARRGLVAREGKTWALTDAGRTAADTAAREQLPRAGTKLARLATLISTSDGAAIENLAAALGWQAHTVRAALTRLRQRGLNIERINDDGGASRYRTLSQMA